METKTLDPKFLPGRTLPNGYVVLRVAVSTSGGDCHEVVVMAISSQKYATWKARGDDARSTFSGRYFDSPELALADFCERIA